MKHTGLSTGLIPVGATVTRIYWTVPGMYTVGSEHADHADALEQAVENLAQLIEQHEKFYAKADGTLPANFLPLPERIFVAQRWAMAWKSASGSLGSGIDTEVQRFEYESLEEATRALSQLQGDMLSSVGRITR
jgi:hypothetical protein